MLTVILSAGHSTRYPHEGFPHQKSMLPMPDGKVLLAWQLERLPGDKFLYISRVEYEPMERAMLFRLKNRFPLKTIWIRKKTKGPLDGLWNMRKYLNVDEELLISYNDELIEQETLIGFIDVCSSKNYQAGLICFDTPDERFTRVPKTKDLSAGCTYYFASGREFVKTITPLAKGSEDGCPAAVYAYGKWMSFEVGKNEFVELGTAQDYKIWAAKQGMTREEMGF